MDRLSPGTIWALPTPAATFNIFPEHRPVVERKARPVFVMGCHRSGTNLLYDTLLSAGGFAVYRGDLPIYKILMPRFGDPGNPRNLRRIVGTFMRSKGFTCTELDAAQLSGKLMAECRTGGAFIRIVMD